MKTKLSKILALAAAALLSLPAGTFSQSDAPARIRTRSELVVVPVTVKDGSGNLISDLRRDEFRILEDGKEQPIALFTTDPFPLSAVVLLQDSLPLKTSDEVQRSLIAIAAGFSASDEVALMTYDQYSQTLQEFTKENDKIFTLLKRLRLETSLPYEGSAPMTAGPKINGQSVGPGVPNVTGAMPQASSPRLDDAVYAAGLLLRDRGRDRRKIIFLVSDGTNSHHNTIKTDAALQFLLSHDIGVYAIAVGSSIFRHGTGPLSKYAIATGGDYYYASKQANLEKLYSRLTEQARNQYTLAFVPQSPNKSKDFHSIDVRIRRPGLDLIARQGYYSGVPR